MCYIFPTIAFVAFWIFVIRLWAFDGAKVPLIFIGLWVIGLLGFIFLGLSRHIFMGIEAVLALVLIVIIGYKGFS